MATKTDKKNAIRQGIIDAAAIYSRNLAGKAFLYVYGDEYFQVSFPVDHFLHLTGVETKLSAKDFYKNAKKGKLTNSQFYFDARHPYANAKKKLPCLKRLSVTMNVFTHIGFDDAEEELKRMEEFRRAQAEIEKKNEKPMSQEMFKAV